MFGESCLEDIRSDIEDLIEMIQRQMASRDTVIAGQHFAENSPGTGSELFEVLGVLDGVPALSLRISLRGRRGAQSGDNHRP